MSILHFLINICYFYNKGNKEENNKEVSLSPKTDSS